MIRGAPSGVLKVSDLPMQFSMRDARKRYEDGAVVIVGVNEVSRDILKALAEDQEQALQSGLFARWSRESKPLRVVGVFDERRTRIDDFIDPSLILGDLDSLMNYVRDHNVSSILVTIPWSAEQRQLELLRKLRTLPVRIDVCLDKEAALDSHNKYDTIAGYPIVTIANRILRRRTFYLKRLEDIVIAASALFFLLPLFLIVALLIKLDSPGPILYRQQRYGFNNRPFSIYKFRSMRVHQEKSNTVTQATRNDPRITRSGAFLRRSSIDELPQLLNVLEGSMSIVGPRPHAIPHNEYYGTLFAEYNARHNVHPGITGWAQANGLRGETDTEEKMRRRVEYDLYYIENWSLLFDIKIIWMTFVNVWRQKTAY